MGRGFGAVPSHHLGHDGPRTVKDWPVHVATAQLRMYTKTCGDGGQHWYSKPDQEMCRCGQVPQRFLAAVSCDCGGSQLDPPGHQPGCRCVKWAQERSAWIEAHPRVAPALVRIERKVRAR